MSDAREHRPILGSRVVVRYRIEDPEHPLTDALGEVVEVTGDAVVIRTRRGDVRVPIGDIALVKGVPAAPARRAPRR